jgi:hypothetical protein
MISDRSAPIIWGAKRSSTFAQSSAHQVLHNRESSALPAWSRISLVIRVVSAARLQRKTTPPGLSIAS